MVKGPACWGREPGDPFGGLRATAKSRFGDVVTPRRRENLGHGTVPPTPALSPG